MEDSASGGGDTGGYVTPKQNCAHHHDHILVEYGALSFVNSCVHCHSSKENWLCLECNEVFCSRYVNCHMQNHWLETISNDSKHNEGHCIALSLSDITVWCYICEQYIKHNNLQNILITMENLKFNSQRPLQSPSTIRTAFFHDPRTDLHQHPSSPNHYENPSRIQQAYDTLVNEAILACCHSVRGREATKEELLRVHTAEYIDLLFSTKIDRGAQERFTADKKDVYVNFKSTEVACLAAGGLIEVTEVVLKGKVKNGFALIRPPGHHCESNRPGGFCLLNNVAIAVAHALTVFDLKRILIVDWDVHHGNGIQEIFYSDERVMYMSLHRHEHIPGYFYPDEGKSEFVGVGKGEGRNMNVPFPYAEGGYGDDDYLAVFEQLFLPVGREFDPELVFVCAGFDAVKGDPMGEFNVTPECFGKLTVMLQSRLLSTANGKVILSVEGGYNSGAVSGCVLSCMRALTNDVGTVITNNITPKSQTLEVIKKTKQMFSVYWESLKN